MRINNKLILLILLTVFTSINIYAANNNLKVLIVDGFDRLNTGFTGNTSELVDIHKSILNENALVASISDCKNEDIEDGSVILSDFNVVIWILGEESTTDETFSSTEQEKVKLYLENGGSLFVSGAEIGWDLVAKAESASDSEFYANYLKADYVNDGNSALESVTGVASSLFESVDFSFSQLWKIDYPDVINTAGSNAVFNYNGGEVAGVSYKGTFGTSDKLAAVIYLPFPIETANTADVKKVMDASIDFFSNLNVESAPVANNDNAVTLLNQAVVIDVLKNDLDNENNIDQSSINITLNPSNGVAVVEDNKIKYTPEQDFIGDDVLKYKIFDLAGNTSEEASVSIKVENTTGLPFETEVDMEYPKRDLRSSFLTTVYNIDWPSSMGANPSWQMDDLKQYIEYHHQGNANAFFFQVRPMADAFYNSSIEPWSHYLTGTQGKDPGFDPLQLAIDECHAKGMELHAWLNPYRTKAGSVVFAANHIEVQHPEWIMDFDDHRILNPGIPEVVDYIVSVVEDIITNYDVDGIHFDDYFYPYGGTPAEMDANEYALYNPNNLNLDDWRRENINNMVKSVYEKIQEVNTAQNKNIVFGISPFGIWKSGTPTGIVGTSAYYDLYADALAWLEGGYIDYIAPQLYWKIYSSGQDYLKLAAWWDDMAAANGRYQFVSQAPYRMSTSGWSVSELQNQISYNRDEKNTSTLGQVFYSAKYFASDTDNDGYRAFKTKLLETNYKYPSVSPSYIWKENVAPNKPENLAYSGAELTWDEPLMATDNDTARRYIIYGFQSMEEMLINKNNGRRILAVTGSTSVVVPDTWLSYGDNFVAVSALDKNNNESELSNVVVIESRPEYCDAKGLNSSSEWIEKVQFHNTVKNSGNNGGYADFTNTVFELQIGHQTEISLTPGFSGSSLYEHWKVYIDFNNDGSFDSGDLLYQTSSASTSTLNKVISLPSNLKEGVYKMRIMMMGASSNTIEACSDIANGEVEDYLVRLTTQTLNLDDNKLSEIEGLAFPNPFNSELNLRVNSKDTKKMTISVYNISGQIIYQKSFAKRIGENIYKIDSNNWQKGVYLVLIKDESGNKTVKEVFKN